MSGDVIIIGGGASGMTAAVFAARKGVKVMLIESNNKTGKKLLMTGNGKCNLSNRNMDISYYNSDSKEFVSNTLALFDLNKTIEFFKSIGIIIKEKNKYLYPHSEQASSVNDALYNEMEKLNVDIQLEQTVIDIKHENNKFTVVTNKTSYITNKVILSTGGLSYPKTGSKGFGYEIAEKFGHNIVKTDPSLVQLHSSERNYKGISGVRADAAVSFFINKELIDKQSGEIIFTDYGISGIPIFQISGRAVKALNLHKKAELYLDFAPEYSQDELCNYFTNIQDSNSELSYEYIFRGAFNNKLIYSILCEKNINADTKCSKVKKSITSDIVNYLKNYHISIDGNNGFDSAQSTSGGIITNEINNCSMESKLINGLYFTGEVINADGLCGGYNLQWAWSTGAIAGREV